MDLATIALALASIELLLVGSLGFLLIRRYGELVLRLEMLEQRFARSARRIASSAAGLPSGAVAPDFELPDLAGNPVRLSQWQGRRVLLIFLDPDCAHSRKMLTDLAALPTDQAARGPMPLIVSVGAPEENRRLFEAHGIRWPVLLQDDREVALLYRLGSTPMGYLIDECGRTAGPVAVGAQAVLALAEAPPTETPDGPANGTRSGRPGRSGVSLTRSVPRGRSTLDGLPAGTPAPGFRLPRADGGELSLEDFRGRPVLLVFSDPTCAPCDRLMPRLEQVQRRSPGPRVVMISRGDLETIRATVAEHGLTFPVLMQRQWEVSRAYDMLATPIAYLIDESGVIEADVAVGADAVLALAARRGSPGDQQVHGDA